MSDAMIRRLRHKVTLASMAAVLVSLGALILAINYANYLQTTIRLRSVMDEMSELEGERREAHANDVDNDDDDEKPVIGGWGQWNSDADEGPQAHRGRQSAHVQYANRFFSVIVDDEGNARVLAKGYSEFSDDEAEDLAKRVLAAKASEGMLDDYLYEVRDEDEDASGETHIFFLDCTTDMQSLHQLLAISLAVGAGAFAIASAFVFKFSELATRPLVESAQKQKRFVADAGHELKTPLSVIATNMDILEADLADMPDEQEWIDSTNRQVENMRRLVGDLISLSKLEEGVTDLVPTEVSLSDLAHECVLTFAQLAAKQGRKLEPHIEEDVGIVGDEPSIRQLMTILVDNALKYATGDGTVVIELTRQGSAATFVTRNDWAHNVDPQKLSSLFDRFVRGDTSRDRSGGNNGYGLGLSIARAIAERNHIRLDVCEDEAGRIVFSATFPNR